MKTIDSKKKLLEGPEIITRVANDSSAPTNVEVNAVLGRDPVSGDIVTVSYNNYNNAVVYRYITSWSLFTTYITGSLIVENTITASKLSVTSASTNSKSVSVTTYSSSSKSSKQSFSVFMINLTALELC